MNLRSIDLNLLTIFDAVMAERNISKAAEKIAMSQPAVSAALSRLKLVMQDELFVRSSHGVKPTPRALELEAPIRTILNMISETVIQAREFDYTKSDRVFSFASMDYGGIALVPFLLKHLQDLGATVQFRIWPQYERDLRELMHFGTVDLAMDNVPIIENDFKVEMVRKEPGYCLVRKGHPVIQKSLSLEQFLETPHVVLYPRTDRLSMFDQFLISKGLRRNHGIRVPSFFNMPYIVRETDMICSLPERVALQIAEQFDLNVFPVPVDGWVAPMYLMWHSSLEADQGHKWLREIVMEHCK